MITFEWKITPEQVWPEISKRQVDAIERAIVRLIEKMAPEVEAWMKANHAWKNDTGAAEAGLHVDLVHIAQAYAGLVMSHGEQVAHAKWLELIQRGRFSVLRPALDVFRPRLLREVEAIIRKYSS